MCGILFALSTTRIVEPDAELLTVLQRRGPDSTTTITRTTFDEIGAREQLFLTFTSTVLSLRGDLVVKQPYHETQEDSVLCWNGEAWHIAGARVTGNDTQQVFKLLQAPNHDTGAQCSPSELAERLATVAGPYAFVFFDKPSNRVYFGRDFLGRRSLLWQISIDGSLIISSVSIGTLSGPWEEVEADGVYCIDLSSQVKTEDASKWGSFVVTKHPYSFQGSDQPNSHSVLPSLTLNKQTTRGYSTGQTITAGDEVITLVHRYLADAVRTRIRDIPLPPTGAGTNETATMSRLAILFSGGLDCTLLARIAHDLLSQDMPIDLLNVAFQNPRIHKNIAQDGSSAYELCPDRLTGRASFQELIKTCPGRSWRFVAINVPYNEFLEHKRTVISLIHPHNTEMDLSISCALYFAARGSGLLSTSTKRDYIPYNTTARVLLSGLGADELFAGYTRHRTTYQRGGLAALYEELELDIRRLSKRNLGRDDRVTAHWSKEVRHPYLDEAFVQWTLDCPIFEKCGFSEDAAPCSDSSATLSPDKKALRCLAWRLGLKTVANEKKRAIQFGARTAKMETNKTKGTTLLS